MAIIDNPIVVGGGAVDQDSALQYMLNNKTSYLGIASGLTSLVTFPAFTQPGGVTNYEYMCYNCPALTTAPTLTTGSNYQYAFYGCGNLVDASGIGSITNGKTFAYMFYNCTSLTTLPDLSNAGSSSLGTSLEGTKYMFYNCSSLTQVNMQTSFYTIYQYTPTMERMFSGCTNLTSFHPMYNNRLRTTKCTTFNYAFNSCSSLTSVILSIGLPSGATGVTANYMFYNCTGLQTVSSESPGGAANITIASSMFRGCSALTSVPSDFASLTQVNHMFNGCSSLVNLPQIDMTNVTTATSYIANCSSLSNTSLNNVMGSLLTMTSFTGTKTLKSVGFSSDQATTATGLSNWSALSSAGWTTGY